MGIFDCVMRRGKDNGGVKMEESVTLKLGRYEALRDKARRVDVVEKENGQLKEELTIVRKQLEELQQPVEEEPTCEEGIVNPKIAESSEDSKEKFRARYPDGVTVISVDDLKKSILLCDKGIYSSIRCRCGSLELHRDRRHAFLQSHVLG